MAEYESGNDNARLHNHERAADPADTANRPLEPRSAHDELHQDDVPHPEDLTRDPHHKLNTLVGDPDETSDSDPYRGHSAEDDADRASGVGGEGQDDAR